MRILKVVFRPETAMPALAVVMASAASVALVLVRVVWTGDIHYGFLVWNLFLAWLPLIFAFLACDHFQREETPNWKFLFYAGAWLLFFPNAPYICTDIIHLTARFYGHFWVDLILILFCAFVGLVLGFLSLFLMQSVVARQYGKAASWLFIAVVAGLSGFGIYLGRFLRLNSWDVLLNPLRFLRGVGHWAANPVAHPNAYAFPLLFGTFLFFAYVMLYALTHLQHPVPGAAKSSTS